jgi:hypothetical protein
VGNPAVSAVREAREEAGVIGEKILWPLQYGTGQCFGSGSLRSQISPRANEAKKVKINNPDI